MTAFEGPVFSPQGMSPHAICPAQPPALPIEMTVAAMSAMLRPLCVANPLWVPDVHAARVAMGALP